MTSRLRVRNCGGVAPRVLARPLEEPLAIVPSGPVPPRRPPADDATEKFGVIVFEGGPWRARRVVLAFDTPLEAASYAAENSFADYLIAPLSFLAPSGVPWT
jgi:hypothetical protein